MRSCKICGREILTRNKNVLYCSPLCSSIWNTPEAQRRLKQGEIPAYTFLELNDIITVSNIPFERNK